MSKSARWTWIIIGILAVIGIVYLSISTARKSNLLDQVASKDMKVRVAATRQLLDEDIIPAKLAAQPIINRSKITQALAEIVITNTNWANSKKRKSQNSLIIANATNQKVISILVSMLSDPEDAPRRWARTALIEIGAPALPALGQVLVEGDDNAKKLAVEALTQLGEPSIPYLRRLLADATARANAATCLGNIGTDKDLKVAPPARQEALAPLLRAVSSTDADLANAAMPVLGDDKVAIAVAPLRAALAQAGLRKNAIIALGEIADKSATKDLLPYIKDATLRMDVARALGQLQDVQAAVPLAAMLNVRNRDYNNIVVWALQSIGAPAAPVVVGYLGSSDVWIRRGAAQALYGDAAPDTIPALNKALSDADPQVRAAATSALGWPGNTQSIALLLNALHDKDEVVIDAAISALGNVGPSAIPSLLALFNSEDPRYALYSSRALFAMGDEVVSPSLLAALDSTSAKTQSWAAITLADMGEQRAVPKLEALLHAAPNSDLRIVLARGLRKLGKDVPVG
jgi:HEAT repeat protein